MKHTMTSIFVVLAILQSGTVFAADNAKIAANSPVRAQKSDTIQTPAAKASEISWHRYSEGMELAKKLNKKVFLEFTAKWCGYCKKMKATTFKDPGVVSMLEKYYVSISVDGDSRDTLNFDGYITTEQGLTREQYGVSGFPTYWFLTSAGERIAPVQGYRDSNSFMDILDYLKDDQYKTVKFKDYMDAKQKKN